MPNPEPLNVDAALQGIGGDMDLLREIAGLCLEEYPKLLVEVRAAISAQNAKALEHSAHTLKGVVSNFAAENARKAALALELIGRNGNLADSPAALVTLESELAALRPALEKLAQK